MTPVDWLLLFLAAVAAGAINATVGSGTLITFPTLLALGYPPVLANVTNSLGMVPGSVAGAWAYRRELAGQRERAARLGPVTALGAVIGAALLLVMPASVFDVVVPVLIVVALVLVVGQPRITAALAERAAQNDRDHVVHPRAVTSGVFATGVYGGYFGAAQGVVQLAVLGIGFDEGIQRSNALKNVLVAVANFAAGIVFVLVTEVDWAAVIVLALGSAVGGLIGGATARRLDTRILRGIVVLVGLLALGQLLR